MLRYTLTAVLGVALALGVGAFLSMNGNVAQGLSTFMPVQMDSVDTEADEECLTYEASSSQFEWQDCLGTEGGYAVDFFNGTFAEKFNAVATSTDGTTVQVRLEQAGGSGGDLTARFSTGLVTIDCTPATTTNLTVGSDASPQDNYVYILRSTNALTVSTTGWPSTEHVKVGYFLVPSASFVQTNGAYVNQNWNDAAGDSTGQGHLTHMTERIRRDGAYYGSGIDGNGTDGYLSPTASNVEFKSTAGTIYQMHPHTYVAKDTSTGDTVLVKNWSGDAYHDITNLFDITADSGGNAIGNNKYFNLTFWGVANKGGEFGPIMVNLPSGFYNGQSDAENDVSGYDDYTIPAAFNGESSNGFLIARVTIKMGTTWTVTQTTDLRGTTPATAAGGAAGVTTEFADNTFRVFDETDPTKIMALSVGGITTATTRTITVPDADGTMVLTAGNQTIGGTKTFSSDIIGTGFKHTSGGDYTPSNTDTAGHHLFTSGQTLNSSSGLDMFARITGTINNSGTASTDFLQLNMTTTAGGSGAQNALNILNDAASVFAIDVDGTIGTGVWNGTAIDFSSYTNATGGRSITLSGDSIVADAELYTDIKSFNYASSSLTTSTLAVLSWQTPQAATITEITCNELSTAGTSTIMFEERTSINTAGTDILYSGGLDAGAGVASASSTLANSAIAANAYIVMIIDGITGSPKNPVCDVELTYDD